jgi:hypothetical protein
VETLGSAAPGEVAIELRPAPANLGCDAMLPEYRSVSIRIDALADDQVWAVTDRGASLLTYWSAGFRGGTSLDPAVADAAGVIVARDGDVIVIPDGAWPRLGGYFVCPASSAIYVLLEDPA